jgi:hypothetical protein
MTQAVANRHEVPASVRYTLRLDAKNHPAAPFMEMTHDCSKTMSQNEHLTFMRESTVRWLALRTVQSPPTSLM